ncbi:MAG: hypothetical protein WD045_09445 [Pirellulaceae bacterium]
MPYLIGMDEAGYGPNLGPLVVCATVWHVPEHLSQGVEICDLYAHLAEAVHPSPQRDRLAIADSKKLYGGGKGLRLLEEGVWSTAPIVGHAIPFWTDPNFQAPDDPPLAPWYQPPTSLLPQAAAHEVIEAKRARLEAVCSACEVRLALVAVAAVTAERFNRQLLKWGKKSDVLSHTTLELLRNCLEPLPTEPTFVICDKHGGRNRYGDLLRHHFPEWRVLAEQETRPCSRYVGQREGDKGAIEIRFQSQGEGFLPAALASMFAKYQRELAMAAFNQFWISHLPALRPTAGYPLDAKRFAAEVTQARRKLRVTVEQFWRAK